MEALGEQQEEVFIDPPTDRRAAWTGNALQYPHRVENPESQIGQLPLVEANAFEFDPSRVLSTEQANATTQEYASKMERDFVEQTGPKTLPSESGATRSPTRLSPAAS